MKPIFFIIIISFIAGCTCNSPKKVANEVKTEFIYSYSVLAALNNSIYSGDLKISGLKTKGNFGLGTYEGLNGEMVMLDGAAWQVLEDGTIMEADDEGTTPYAVVTFFEEDKTFEITGAINYEKLKSAIKGKFPSENYFYAIKIKGQFSSILCGGAPKQEKPYTKTLVEIIKNRPQFRAENIPGTIVGFYCPSFVGEVTLAGFHLHFISDDKSFGGHLINFQSSNLQVFYDQTKSMIFDLQGNQAFQDANLKPRQGY